jgi:DNA-binding transcriptional ArsR family regulator
MTENERLDGIFFALSDGTRRAMLRELAKHEATVGQLSAPFDLAPATMSKHLRVLQDAGLVTQARAGRFRRTRLNPGPLWQGLDWIGQVRAIWNEQLDALEALLVQERPASRAARPARQAGPRREARRR